MMCIPHITSSVHGHRFMLCQPDMGPEKHKVLSQAQPASDPWHKWPMQGLIQLRGEAEGTGREKGAIQHFLLLYSWALFQKHQCSALDKIFYIFFSRLATGRLPLAADLSAQEDRKYRADHSWSVKPKIKIKYTQCQLPTLGLSKENPPLNRGIKNICFTNPRSPLACLAITAQEIRSGLGPLISHLLLSFRNKTNLMLKTPSQQETWVNTRGKTGKRTNQKHPPPPPCFLKNLLIEVFFLMCSLPLTDYVFLFLQFC